MRIPRFFSENRNNILLIIILVFLIYSNAILNDFVADDYGNIVSNERIQDISKLPEIFTTPFWSFSDSSLGYYTPLTSLSFAADYGLWGLSPGGFHFTNIVIHVINSVLVFIVASKLVKNKKISLVAALMFASFPVAVDSVAWISGRTHMLALMFSLVSFWFFIKYRKMPETRYCLLSLVSFALAILSKETAIFLPLIFIIYDFLYHKKTFRGLKKDWLYYGGFFSVLIVYALVTFVVVGNILPEITSNVIYPTNPLFGKGYMLAVINSPLIFSYYTLMILTNTSFDFPPFLINSAFNPIWLLASLLLIIPLYYTYRVRKKYVFVTFFSLWFLINLIPAIASIPSYTTYIVNRLSYIPSLGLAVLLPAAVLFISKKRNLDERVFTSFFILVIIMFSGLAFARTFDWRNEGSLLESDIRHNPGNYFAYNQLGNYYLGQKQYNKATLCFERSLEIEPNYSVTYNNLGNTYYMQGKFNKAAEVFERALEIEPDSVENLNNLGNTYVMAGRYGDALEKFAKILEIDPENANAYFSVGVIYFNFLEDKEIAKQFVERALEIEPENQEYLDFLKLISE